MYSTVDISKFLEEYISRGNINFEDDIFLSHGITGDDFHEMIEKYADTFKVNMTNYLWYFHTKEEGSAGLGSLFFKPPYERVKRISVTPAMLLDFANTGIWLVDYPAHRLPKRRWDLIINTIVLILFSLVVIPIFIYKKIYK